MSNTRVVSAIVAFAVAFIFSAGLVRIIFPAPAVEYGVFERRERNCAHAAAIEDFIRRDESNGDDRSMNAASSDTAEAVLRYWRTSSSMDASGFPQDFQRAWSLHMNAWGRYAQYLQDAKRGRVSYSYTAERQLNGEINRTWDDVLRIGRGYGANVY